VDGLLPREPRVIAPGAVHVPDWLTTGGQRELVAACRAWSAGLRRTRLPSGGLMSVRTVCLGWQWVPYRYSRLTPEGEPVLPFPDWLAELGRAAVRDAAAFTAFGATGYDPDVALVNFYDDTARMGLHVDREERSPAPVVSLSLGDSCLFRFGNTESRGKPWTDVELRSGDLFVFGGPARFAYHGVPKTYPGTGDPATGPRTGRLNVTLRESGLSGPPGGRSG
jgi:DNA oxidative demethylase